MQQSSILKSISVITLILSCASAYAQAQEMQEPTMKLDTLTKVIGVALTLGGFFMGYMQMKMALKIAEVEATFQKALFTIKTEFVSILHTETEKQSAEFKLAIKEVESKMATRHDINNFKQLSVLQHENMQQAYNFLKEQLQVAARLAAKD